MEKNVYDAIAFQESTLRVCAGDERLGASLAASLAACRPTCAHPGRCSCVDLVPSADHCLSPPGATAGPTPLPFQLFESPVHELVSSKPSLQGGSGCAQGVGHAMLHPWWHHGDSPSVATTAPHLQMLLSTSRLKQCHCWASCSCSEEEQPWVSLALPLFAASQMLRLLSRAELEGNSNIKAQLCRVLSTGLKSSSQLCGLNSGLVTHSHCWHPGCGLNTT